MKTFFKDLDTIDQFTMNLKIQPSLQCPHCLLQGHLVSHGFVYKKSTETKKTVIGKRVFCSNRHSKKGCGRMTRLYLADDIPTLQYDTKHLFIFITSLLSFFSIQKSYKKATHTSDPRNAYRWIKKLWTKLIEYRKFLTSSYNSMAKGNFSTLRFQVLLPTIQKFVSRLRPPCLPRFQLIHQTSFL